MEPSSVIVAATVAECIEGMLAGCPGKPCQYDCLAGKLKQIAGPYRDKVEAILDSVKKVVLDCAEARDSSCLKNVNGALVCDVACMIGKISQAVGLKVNPEQVRAEIVEECTRKPQCTVEAGRGKVCSIPCLLIYLAYNMIRSIPEEIEEESRIIKSIPLETSGVSPQYDFDRLARLLGLPQYTVLNPEVVCERATIECTPDGIRKAIYCAVYKYVKVGMEPEKAERMAVNRVGEVCGTALVLDALSGK